MALQITLRMGLPTLTCDGPSMKPRLLLIFTIWLICYPTDALGGTMKVKMGRNQSKHSQTGNGAMRQYPACPIPQLKSVHESILKYVNNKTLPMMYNCAGFYPLLFSSTLQSTIIPAKEPAYFQEEGYESCCYRRVLRDWSGGDINELLPSKCFPVHLTAETNIPADHEFIVIFCKKKGSQDERLNDVHSFVHLKPSRTGNNNDEIEGKFNVVIFGMDGISRLHFLRSMPQSYAFLKNELGAVEMFGYNKVGENTPPNLMPMLMGGMPHGHNFNKIPFIWKDYSKHGYYTMFSEDDYITLFNDIHLNFDHRSTDYYLRPFSHFSDDNFQTYSCYGPRLNFQVLLDYMEKYVDTMSRSKKNFFELTWVSSMTHSFLNTARLGDPLLLKSLRWLKQSGRLKSTIFILVSDHGNRLDGIVNTTQGMMEERLPLLHLVFPQSFKKRFPLAYSNLLYNADKLVTAYDLHESLREIANLDIIGNRKLLERKNDLFRLGRNLPRGISLFLPIPEFRTCEMAGISQHFCSCTYMETVNVSDPEVGAAAKANIAISHINYILRSNSTNCAILKLHNVIMVRRVGHSHDYYWNGYAINFETSPGGGQFEALIAKKGFRITWRVQGPIVRTNPYGNKSHCVSIALKPYCNCLI